MKGNKSGFLWMILSVVGIVLFVNIFANIMDGLDDLLLNAAIADFIAFEICVHIAPTVLLLGGIFAAGWGYQRGYKNIAAGSGDTGGMLRMVMGVLLIILFITLFDPIATAFGDLYALYVGSDYIAFDTVLTIVPTVLFLGGIFAGISTSVGGWRSRKRRGALRSARP